MCGGMALSSLDYYYLGLQIPQQTSAPTSDGGTNPVYAYILKRQLDAHRGSIKATAAAAGITPRQLNTLMTKHGLRKEDYRGD